MKQRKMQLRSFIKYLRDNKGFVVIEGVLYRHGNAFTSGCPSRMIQTYHVEDIGYKHKRMNCSGVYSPEMLEIILYELDVSKLSDKVRANVMQLWKETYGK